MNRNAKWVLAGYIASLGISIVLVPVSTILTGYLIGSIVSICVIAYVIQSSIQSMIDGTNNRLERVQESLTEMDQIDDDDIR